MQLLCRTSFIDDNETRNKLRSTMYNQMPSSVGSSVLQLSCASAVCLHRFPHDSAKSDIARPAGQNKVGD